MSPHQSETPEHERPGGRRLALARAGALALALPALALAPLGLARSFQLIVERSPRQALVGPGLYAALDQLGLAPAIYASFLLGLALLNVLAFCGVGALIALRRGDSAFGIGCALALALCGAAVAGNLSALGDLHPALDLLARLLRAAALAGMAGALWLFPDGRFYPGWARPAGLLGVAQVALAALLPGAPPWDWRAWPGGLGALAAALHGGLLLAALGARYRAGGAAARRQLRWLALSLGLAGVGVLVIGATATIGGGGGSARLLAEAVRALVAGTALLGLPAAIGVALLRYRLWAIDPLISRALRYAALTACVVGLYVLIVGSVGALFQTGENTLVSLLAAGLIAVLFQPLRDRLEQWANRLIYGERDEPYTALARLGQRLEGSLSAEATLPTIVQTLREALRLPYVAVALDRGGSTITAAAAGSPVPAPLVLPLIHQGETIGRLMLGPRAADDPFSPLDRRLIDDLARQVAVAAGAVRLQAETLQLAADLQRSREQLVAAREEERRRLRRDLHDGLGPSIAAQTLKAGTARFLLRQNPDAAEAMLRELEHELKQTLAEVRQVVYNLRPPALDDLGLLGALRAAADRFSGAGAEGRPAPTIRLSAPDPLPQLSAATEVAIYRIVTEALSNVVRHAEARSCTVALEILADQRPPALCLRVSDDGRGLGDAPSAGAGTSTMRERAEELGGRLTIRPLPEGGTEVVAVLPIG